MTGYARQQILAMELDRSHIGRLVQLIAEDWSITGTLEAVAQHDNRNFEIEYPSRRLVPVGGEIYAVVTIGPWRAEVSGNQPVTVEYAGAEIEDVDPVRQLDAEPAGPDVIPGQLALDEPWWEPHASPACRTFTTPRADCDCGAGEPPC